MPGIAQFWQTLRPLRKVGKLRGVITVPVFNEACGIDVVSYNFLTTYLTAQAGVPLSAQPVNRCTWEIWVKLNGTPSAELGLMYIVSNAFADPYSGLYVSTSRKVVFKLKEAGGTNYTLTTAASIPYGEWVHIAGTWDGTTMRVYINGQLDTVTTAFAAGVLDSDVLNIFRLGDSTLSLNFLMNEARVWDVAHTQDQILQQMHTPRDTTGVIDTGLLIYFPLNQGTGTSVPNSITGTKAFSILAITGGVPLTWVTDDSYPYRLGASYYPLQFAIATDGQYFSLKYPARKPYASVNFVPCIRWTEDGEVKRYRLWDAITGFDAAPVIPEYRGERIPDGSFLEIWNLDGNRTVLLTEAFDLETSILHVVENATTTARTSDATPVANTELAEPFPLTPFPLQFDTQQTF